ncbi:MAG: type II toxin-antitoxin system VapC family toxin [Theionarchaea archaeon]|nr:type II toxin-antitoxin system VapC family toxin [Theionarchaea archaeon]
MAIMRCLDSDFLIDILAGKREAESKMLEIENDRLATTAINAFEILFGAKYSQNMKNIKESHRILSGLDILTFDLEAAEEASRIHVQHMREGNRLPTRDLFIASVAKVPSCVVVTRNVKHFRISGLEVETW